MKYRKKPVVIDAERFSEKATATPLSPEFEAAVCRNKDNDAEPERPHIHTLEGAHILTEGDMIIKGVKGEFYPCKPDIFAATYDKVGAE